MYEYRPRQRWTIVVMCACTYIIILMSMLYLFVAKVLETFDALSSSVIMKLGTNGFCC